MSYTRLIIVSFYDIVSQNGEYIHALYVYEYNVFITLKLLD